MRKIAMLLLLLFSLESIAQTICEGQIIMPTETFNICDNNPWVLVFEDDFDGNELDLTKWEIIPWGQGALYGNNGDTQEFNTIDNNTDVSNGKLKIITKKETIYRKAISYKPEDEILDDGLPNYRRYDYTSSNIWTKYKFTYGKFEARIKIPKGKGFKPALWTYAGNPWNEIDVFEFWNEADMSGNYDPNKLSKVHHMTLHYENEDDVLMCETNYTGNDFSQDFHVFSVIWEKNKIEWYVDGQLMRTDYKYYSPNGQIVGCWIYAWNEYLMNIVYPKDPMAIILNLAIGHGFDENNNLARGPDDSTPFPSEMEIDWVRYYQKTPCQDVYINDASELQLEDEIFNNVAGKNVTFNCNYIIKSTQQLSVLAKNSIILKPGFHSKVGSIFSAKMSPDICNSLLKTDDVKNDTEITTSLSNQEIQLNDNLDISIFPNPNDGTFHIYFKNNEYTNYQIKLFDLKGKMILSVNNINNSFITLNVSKTKNGPYMLYLFNEKNKSIITRKIIFYK